MLRGVRVTIAGFDGAISPKDAQLLGKRLLERGQETDDDHFSQLGLALRKTDTFDRYKEEVELKVGPIGDDYRKAVANEAAALANELGGEQARGLEAFAAANNR